MNNAVKSGEGRAPFTREEIVTETRKAALTVASLISWFGPNDRALSIAEDYLGVSFERYDLEGKSEQELSSIPIESHFLYRVVMDAYDYAYQIGADALEFGADVVDRMHEVSGILTSFPQTDFNGEPSPLDKLNPQKLRQVLETFLARYHLDYEYDLTIRELALLANMGEAAVRTSLSKEGITTVSRQKGQHGGVEHSQALPWLLGRRGFVPSRIPNEGIPDEIDSLQETPFSDRNVKFPKLLESTLRSNGFSPKSFAIAADVPIGWLERVLSEDEAVDVDLDAIVRMAKLLNQPTPIFAARAVENLLERAQPGAE